jgi:hypothetical protein
MKPKYSKFKIGDLVRVMKKEGDPGWVGAMDKTLGHDYKVVDVERCDGVQLDNSFIYAYTSLKNLSYQPEQECIVKSEYRRIVL